MFLKMSIISYRNVRDKYIARTRNYLLKNMIKRKTQMSKHKAKKHIKIFEIALEHIRFLICLSLL